MPLTNAKRAVTLNEECVLSERDIVKNKERRVYVSILAVSFLLFSSRTWARPWYPDEKPGDEVAGQGKTANPASAAKPTGKSACPPLPRANMKRRLKGLVLDSAAPFHLALSGIGTWLNMGAGKSPSGKVFNCIFTAPGSSRQKSPAELSLTRDMRLWVAANPPTPSTKQISPQWVGRFLNAAQSDSYKIVGKSVFKNKKEKKGRKMKRSRSAFANSGLQRAAHKVQEAQAQTNAQNKVLGLALGRALPPPSPTRARYFKILSARLHTNGASLGATNYARKIQMGMLAHAPQSVLRNLAASTSLNIIPWGKKLTQIPPFTALAGKKTFDGRLWDNVEGIAYTPAHKNSPRKTYVAASESDLIGNGPLDLNNRYRKGFLILHEYGHAVRFALTRDSDWRREGDGKAATLTWHGMASRLRESLSAIPAAFKNRKDVPTLDDSTAVYQSAMRKYGTIGLGHYADSNPDEAFAQATAAYLGVGDNGETANTLRRRDPQMYHLMREVYGRASANRFYKKGERSAVARLRFKNWTLSPRSKFGSMSLKSGSIFARRSHDNGLIKEICGKIGPARCKKYFQGPLPQGF